MNFGRLVLATVFLVALVFLGGVNAVNTTSDCGTLSIANTTYVLDRNIGATGTCITAGTNDITLNCAGYVINYSSSGAGDGVIASGRTNVTIANCTINQTGTSGSSFGVYFTGSSNGSIQNNTVTTRGGSSPGIYVLSSSNYNNVTGNNVTTYGSSAGGIDVSTSSVSNALVNNTITLLAGVGDGIDLDTNCDNSTLTNNTVNCLGAASWGIYLLFSSNSVLTNNTVISNTTDDHGVFLNFGSANNTLTGNKINTSQFAAFGINGNTYAMFNQLIDETNLINGKPLNYSFNVNNTVFQNLANKGKIVCAFCNNVTYDNITLSGADGMFFAYSPNTTVKNSNINVVKDYGIYTIGTTTGSNFTNNVITLSGSSASTALFAVVLTSASNVLTYNNITSSVASAPGLKISASSNVVENNNIVTSGANGYGVYFYFSGHANNLTNNNIQTSGSGAFGIYFSTAANNSIKDSIINASNAGGVTDVYTDGALGASGENNLTNCTFNTIAFKGDAGAAKVNVFWYLNVHATDSWGADLASAVLNISDVNGTSLYNGTANSTGWMSTPLTVLGYSKNLTGGANTTYNKTPHWVNASKAGYISNNSASGVSASVVVTRSLKGAPTVSLSSPADGTTESASFNFGYTPLDTSGFSGASLILWYSNGTLFASASNASALANNSVNYLTYAFTMEGAYLWNVNVTDNSGSLTGNASSNRTVFIVYPQGGGVASASPAASETPSATASASASAGGSAVPSEAASPAPTLAPSPGVSASPGVEPSVSPPSATASAEERGAFDALTEVKALRDSASAQGVVSSEVNDLIVRSAQAYAAGDYAGAASFASQAKSLLEEKLVAAGVQKPSAVAGFDWTWVVGFLVLVVLASAYYYYSRKQKRKGL